ncbi:hypothetical protein SK128_023181, partial [Halocaridina rubra]
HLSSACVKRWIQQLEQRIKEVHHCDEQVDYWKERIRVWNKEPGKILYTERITTGKKEDRVWNRGPGKVPYTERITTGKKESGSGT